jgi:threonine synthase
MKFASAAHPGRHASFREALFSGLSPDGGLYHPVEHPDLARLISGFDDEVSFSACAAAVAAEILAPDLGPQRSRLLVRRALDFPVVLRRLDERTLLLELFHGPSAAFKDVGARFLAAAMEELLGAGRERILILVATSGDTGSAVAHAFHDRANIDVAILYPRGRVSELQEKQLTTLGGNVHALEVAGSFDDCQRLAKEAFRDPGLRASLSLTSANSINIGRLLPQAFSYIFAATRHRELGGSAPTFCVPSGNFGNLTAGVYAWRWGLPVRHFIAATNVNDVVPTYLESGRFVPRASVQTLSNAMDVGNPSNFERLLRAFDGDWQRMSLHVEGRVVNDERTLGTIRRVYEEHGIFVDPHTAVGIAAADDYRAAGRDGQVIVLATAHPAKFADAAREATGSVPEMPESLARCLRLPRQAVSIGANFDELSRCLLDTFARR